MYRKIIVCVAFILLLSSFGFHHSYVTGPFSPKTKSAEAASVTQYKTTANLNLRTSASTKGKIILTIPKGKTVQYISKSGTWYKVKYKTKTGYASSKYLTKVQAKLDIEKMKNLGKSEQVILVTNKTAASNKATIQAFEKTNGKWKRTYTLSGVIGKKGMTSSKKEGDMKTPTGKYTLGTAFYRSTVPTTKLSKKKITADSVWVDDSKSPLYNTWQSKSKTKGQWTSAENMNISQYDVGFVINYNTKRTPYKGSAIFFHVEGKSGYTAGCVATSKSNVNKILSWVKPAKNPVIIMTPEADIAKY
ncbi:SH3 domain-containing protein [Pradoshia sp.]|uniref:SH3 domain-containing protein n=1 Tax=Pradoshia sp. TaxID=2651281 RepID=UPI003F0D461B